MSAGSKIVPVRCEPALLAEIAECIASRNHLTRETPWSMSDFIRQAIREKLSHMSRSRKTRRKETACAIPPSEQSSEPAGTAG